MAREYLFHKKYLGYTPEPDIYPCPRCNRRTVKVIEGQYTCTSEFCNYSEFG